MTLNRVLNTPFTLDVPLSVIRIKYKNKKMKQVKKMPRILLVLILAILFSCNSDDDTQTDENSFATDLIGVWELNSVISNGEELIENPNCLDRLTFTETTVKGLEYFDFNNGNGCEIVYGQVIDETAPYTLNGVNLSWNDDEPFSYEIIELSSTTLKLQDVYTEDGETFTDIEIYNRL